MFKINSRNEKLKRRIVKKGIVQVLYHLILCFRDKNVVLKKQHFFKKYFLNTQLKWLTSAAFTKSRTICFLTGRSRSIYRSFRLSRMKIRTYASFGYFPGLAKASW